MKLYDGMITCEEVRAKRVALLESLLGSTYTDKVWGKVKCEVVTDTAYGDYYKLTMGRAYKHKKTATVQREDGFSSEPGSLRGYHNFCSITDPSSSGINDLLERYNQQLTREGA